MKKNGILKAILFMFLAYVLISWFIPNGYYSSSFTTGETSPVGLIDLIKYPIINMTSSVFVLTAICILFIGGLYAVLNKTGVYTKWVDNTVIKFKNGNTFIIISILVFSILTSLTALTLPLFVMVPFFITVILLLGYSKVVAILSTIGAILVGNIASTYGFNINGYLTYFFETDINATIMYRIILFVLLVGSLLLFTLKLAEKKEKVTKKASSEIPFYEANESVKSSTAMKVILVISIIISLIGMYNWSYGLGVELFNNIHTAVTEFEFKGYPIFKNLIGSVDAIGSWSNYELAILLIVVSYVIGLVYKLSFKDITDAFIDGAKKMFPVALYTVFANIIFLLMNSNTDGTMFATIANFLFTKLDKFGTLSLSLVSIVGGLLYNDFPYMVNSIYSQVTALYENLGLASMIQQSFHGLLMLVLPTSTMLVAGLKYLDVSYKEWLKTIWKYLLIALIIIIIIIVLMSIL